MNNSTKELELNDSVGKVRLDNHVTQKLRFSRRRLSAFSKTVIVALLVLAIFMTALATLVAHSAVLLIFAGLVFLVTALIVTGIRWTPLLGSVLCSVIVYVFLSKSSFPLYHLAHPKDAYNPWWLAYIVFVGIVILFWCMVVTVGAGVVAVIQNYWQREVRTSRWFSYALTGLLGVLLGAILLGAFAPTLSTASATTTTNGEPTVHLGVSSFSTSSITIPKGSKLLLVDDGTFEHNISNGTWANGQPMPAQETGAPSVHNIDINGTGKSIQIGPFTTAGTYSIYCSIHQGMMLTIIVQ